MKKIIIIILLASISCYFIYENTKDTKIDLMIISDYEYNKNDNNSYINMLKNNLPSNKVRNINTDYNDQLITISKINDNIINNNKYKNKYINQLLESSEYIILFIGNKEINYYNYYNELSTNKISEFILNYEKLIKNIKMINKKKIIIFNLIPYNNQINNINERLYKLSVKYNLIYIDTIFLLNNKTSLNKDDNIRIYNRIKEEIKL